MSQDRAIRIALLSNAVFSLLAAAAFLGWSGALSRQLGLPAPLYLVIGVGLLPFNADLLHQATRPRVSPLRALGTILADLGWVLATAVVLTGWPQLFTSAGQAAAGGIAAVVAALAVAQAHGLLRLTANHQRRSPASALHVCEHTVPVAPDAAWPPVADLGAIAAYHTGLASATVARADGRVSRTCTDRRGRRWREAVVDMQSGKELVLAFDTTAPDFPFPVTEMRGGWMLLPEAGGAHTRIRVWFEYTPKGGWLGRLVMAAGFAANDRALRATIDRMRPAMVGHIAAAEPAAA